MIDDRSATSQICTTDDVHSTDDMDSSLSGQLSSTIHSKHTDALYDGKGVRLL